MKNPKVVQLNSHCGYISIVYFDESLTRIEAIVIYVMCTHDHPEGIWDFSVVIQMDILNEFYTAPIQCLYMYIGYTVVTVIHAIESNVLAVHQLQV